LPSRGYTEATRWVLEEKARARLFYERPGRSVDGATALFERGGGQAIEIRYYRPLWPSSTECYRETLALADSASG
jgi:hypothetical protein